MTQTVHVDSRHTGLLAQLARRYAVTEGQILQVIVDSELDQMLSELTPDQDAWFLGQFRPWEEEATEG